MAEKTALELIQAQEEAWGEFTKTNDARLKALEAKTSTSDTDAKLAALHAEFAAQQKAFRELEKKAGRPAAGADSLSDDQVEHKRVFGLYLRKGRDEGLAELQRKAMNSTTDDQGGYLVLPEIDKEITRVAGVMGAMYRLANVVTIGTAKYEKRVKASGMAMRRVADGSGGGETTEPTYKNVAIEVHTAEVEPWVNNETLEDAFVNLEADLANEAAIGFAEGANSEFITGNGVGKARGIAAYTFIANSSYAWGSVGYIASGKSAAFASVAPADKVISLQHALKAQYRPGAVWLANDATIGVMRQIKDASGAYYLWQPDPAASFGGRFLGATVEVDDNVADIAAASYSLAYGNMKQAYTIVNRAGTTVLRDNLTTKGVTKFNFRRRFGGGITNFEAVKFMKFATS